MRAYAVRLLRLGRIEFSVHTRVGLVQEPIAAAMASIADRQRRNSALKDGQFLVYDLGGGTFDVAIVQSVGGTINVVGHGGINMLGGTDFDRRVVNGIVRPWLMEQFDLPEDLQKNPTYQRVLRIATFYAEKAKIELSAQPSTRISADESQISARDQAGKEIYLDIPFDRPQIEETVFDQVERSIDACRKLLKENGYQPGDIDRVVFIGGPTRMPIVRSRVPEQLGIPGDLDSDPMTAVAFGAAIFAESRDWSGGAVTAKPTRATARVGGAIKIEYGYATPSAAPPQPRLGKNPAGQEPEARIRHFKVTLSNAPIKPLTAIMAALGRVELHYAGPAACLSRSKALSFVGRSG
jgi:molecular chaperone DnaK